MVWVYINKPQYLNLNCRDQNWTQPSMCGLTSTKRRRIITSLVLPLMSCGCSPRSSLPLLLQLCSAASGSACCPQVSKAAPNHRDPSLCSAFWRWHPSTRLHTCLCTCCTRNLWLTWVLDNLFEAPSSMKAWARWTFEVTSNLGCSMI